MDWIEHLELRKTGSHINVKLSVKGGKDRVILALSGSDFIK